MPEQIDPASPAAAFEALQKDPSELNAEKAFRAVDKAFNTFVGAGLNGLILDSHALAKPCDFNAKLLIAAAPQFEDLHYDNYLCRVRIGDRDWSDHDDRETLCWLQSENRVSGFTLGQVRTAVMALAYARRKDSLFEFVMGLPAWDGTPRIECAFCDAWGADDTPFTRAASKNLFVALHARAVKPGSQVDHLWCFEGPQGIGKSAALRKLGGNFHAEISAPVGHDDFYRQLQGIWIAELSELDALRGREASTIKRLLSSPSDRYVEKYERHAVTYPRRAVAVATTNESHYWQDATGARRLIPIRVNEILLDFIEDQRLQWFAEARVEYEQKCSWHEFPALTAAQAQEDRQIVDPWEDILRDAMTNGRRSGDGKDSSRITWPAGWVSSAELMRTWLRLEPHMQGQTSSVRLGKVMRRLGFVPKRFGKKSERGWEADTSATNSEQESA